MASKLGSHNIPPLDLTNTDPSTSVHSSKIELSDNQKRFSVVGIALISVLIPRLQRYVDEA